MPWKETCPMRERVILVSDYLEGRASMSALCKHYGVSRRVAYKWVSRFEAEGVEGLKDRSRAPRHRPHRISPEIVELLVQAKKAHPCWGPKKLVVWLATKHPEKKFPAPSTAGDWLKRFGLVESRKRRMRIPRFTEPFAHVENPNDLWCIDFKGQFKTRDEEYCYPLTITDAHSRVLLECQGLHETRDRDVHPRFEQVFATYGLPRAIRSDNGPPFVSKSAGGMSRLSIWWLKLGITHERIDPGHPEQNGRHERMHLTLKLETTRPPGKDLSDQQKLFDEFRLEFNTERPHEALGMEPPIQHYEPSTRALPSQLPAVEYPDDYRVRKVNPAGRIRWPGRHFILVGQPFVGESIGCKQIEDHIWEIYFLEVLLGFVDVTRIDEGLLRV